MINFSTGEQLLALCTKEGKSISEIMIQREAEKHMLPQAAVIEEMHKSYVVMRKSITDGIEIKQSSVTGLTGGDSLSMFNYAEKSLMGPRMSRVVAASMGVVEVNSAMGQIVAAPTAGSSGILPGTLLMIGDDLGWDEDAIVRGLFTAGGIGMIIAINATTAGSEGGCQAETGVAAAMAAGALTELREGSPEKALNAAAIALKNVMGLVCDPVAGLVECPCIKRNAIGAANAVLSADLSLSGVNSLIPFDEVVMAMKSVGRQMSPDLRETARGGLAATPTGKRLMKQFRALDHEGDTEK